MEILKKNLYRRLFDPNGPNASKLDEAFDFLEGKENEVRSCYNEEIALESDEFLKMMMIDGSFIVQLLRDLSEQIGILQPSYLSSGWMLPAIRRDLIMLENQIPFSVLNKLFHLTKQESHKRSLKCSSLEFFYPLLHADSEAIPESEKPDELKADHFLDLLRSAIIYRQHEHEQEQEQEENQHHMIRTATELLEAGVKIKADKNPKRRLLNISFKKRWWIMLPSKLTIPPLYINDHRGTVLRNIAVFEKCHKGIKPDVTTYLFFFNGLINSAEDVALLHYKGVIHHSLGCDKSVAKLINNITKEMVRDKKESYLYQVVNQVDEYCGKNIVRMRARLVHNYLSSWGVGISTIGAVLALYLTLIQTVYGFKDIMSDWGSSRFGSLLLEALFLTPFKDALKSIVSALAEGYKRASSHGSNNSGDTPREVINLCMEKFSRRNIHSTAERFSNWRGLIRKELESGGNNHNNNYEQGSDSVCIYRIPQNMLKVEPEAYTPQTISIGPYHYGKPHLQDMENLKLSFFRRLFDPNGPNGAKLDEAFNALESVEHKARQCYMEMEKIRLSRDEFLHMMMVDASFIIQLLRDFSVNKFDQVPHLSRWKLPVIRREMVMLENQLPLFVLSKLFELTDDSRSETLEMLALRFFLPMMTWHARNNIPIKSVESGFRIEHLLDLLRSIVVPKLDEKQRGKQTNMVYSITELKKSGVKIKACQKRELLDIRFGNRYFGMFVKELTIPALHLTDHRGTMLRNIVAFEKWHERCKPDVTTWIFFINRLINTEEDVALLHYKGVLNHSLGSDKMVAELINNVTKEMAPDLKECYLHKVVNDANKHFEKPYARLRRVVMHNYVNLLVALSTFGAICALGFTFIQTVCALGEDLTFRSKENETFSSSLKDAFAWVFKFDAATPTHASHSDDTQTK
ncbi:hypothetical protein PIB30_024319 [Stylosanthes scabra]|uniref:Uncharacterized protein n=1 Tax=Stylosanthes scabra TaxID=79078 RepID=A0ABU6Y9T4_9FABA|nr:hypothetical protein [Stylosanthes scabra]